MIKTICPKCKSESGFSKDKLCRPHWRCSKCDVCCVSEKQNASVNEPTTREKCGMPPTDFMTQRQKREAKQKQPYIPNWLK